MTLNAVRATGISDCLLELFTFELIHLRQIDPVSGTILKQIFAFVIMLRNKIQSEFVLYDFNPKGVIAVQQYSG